MLPNAKKCSCLTPQERAGRAEGRQIHLSPHRAQGWVCPEQAGSQRQRGQAQPQSDPPPAHHLPRHLPNPNPNPNPSLWRPRHRVPGSSGWCLTASHPSPPEAQGAKAGPGGRIRGNAAGTGSHSCSSWLSVAWASRPFTPIPLPTPPGGHPWRQTGQRPPLAPTPSRPQMRQLRPRPEQVGNK